MKREKSDLLIVCVFGALLAYLTYAYVLSSFHGGSDYSAHTYIFIPLYTKETWVQGWMTVPYCMWHLTLMLFHTLFLIPVENAAAYTGCLYTLFSYFTIYWIFQRITAAADCKDSSFRSSLLSFCMCIIQGLYFPWLDAGNRYLGIYSMNPMHNPTYTCMKGFSLICFCLVCDIWGKQKDENYRGIFFRVENGLKRYYIYLAVMLFLSVLAKPTFAEMFIPAVAFLMLGELIARLIKKDGSAPAYFRHCLVTLCCAVPSLLYILLQFLAYFIWGGSYGNSSLIITKWFEVWHMYSQNVILSIGLSMAFPLFLVLIDGKYFIKSDMGRLALVGYLISVLEAASLGESGFKLEHGNFLWPMMSGILFMFLVSVIRLLVLERQQADTKARKTLITAAWFLLCLHVVCGVLFIQDDIASFNAVMDTHSP